MQGKEKREEEASIFFSSPCEQGTYKRTEAQMHYDLDRWRPRDENGRGMEKIPISSRNQQLSVVGMLGPTKDIEREDGVNGTDAPSSPH